MERYFNIIVQYKNSRIDLMRKVSTINKLDSLLFGCYPRPDIIETHITWKLINNPLIILTYQIYTKAQ